MYAFNDDLVNNSSYYSTFAGGIIGVADAKNVELYNNIYLGNIFMYTNGYAGKLVGSTGYRNEVTSAETNIISSHNKLSGEIKF